MLLVFEDTGTMHCVTGFAPGLDWRPLDFVEPLPSDRVCGLCGVLARRATALQCSHLLCETCYEGVVACGSRCPLDGDTHNLGSVQMVDFHPGPVFKLKVRCWNSAHGCDFAGPVSALLEHFENDCIHHRASCPRCHQDVPRLQLVQHCADNCSPASGERGVEPTPPVLSDLEKACAEFRQSFAELRNQNYELQTSLNSVARDLKHGLPSETIQTLLCAISGILRDDRVAPIAEMTLSSCTGSRGGSLSKCSGEGSRADSLDDMTTFCVDVFTGHPGSNQRLVEVSALGRAQTRKVRWCVPDLKEVIEKKEHICSEGFLIDDYGALFELDWEWAGDVFCLGVQLCVNNREHHHGARWPFIKTFGVKIVRSQFEHADIHHKIDPDRCVKSGVEGFTTIRLCSLISLRTESIPDVHGSLEVSLQF
ncbi:uncharacterized protein ISCGN_023437 [Ixodes scapularis]